MATVDEVYRDYETDGVPASGPHDPIKSEIRALFNPLVGGSSSFALTGDITPPQITSDQNNYSPTGLSTAAVLRLNTDASRNVTGLAGGSDGRILILHNVGANNIVLKDESASSTAANRFALTGDVTMLPDSAVMMQYDSTSARWRVIGGTGTSVAARERLLAARTYFVRTDGSDSNNGLTNSAGGAFLTLNKARDAILALDLNGFNITVQIVDGTYTGGLSFVGPLVGKGDITFQGNAGTPANVFISTTGLAAAIAINGIPKGNVVTIKDLKVKTTTVGIGISVKQGSNVNVSNIVYDSTAGAQNAVDTGGTWNMTGNCSVIGDGSSFLLFRDSGTTVIMNSRTITFTGTRNYAGAFVNGFRLASLESVGCTFPGGTVAGIRYYVQEYAVCDTQSSGANYFPGNAPGQSPLGGLYV